MMLRSCLAVTAAGLLFVVGCRTNQLAIYANDQMEMAVIDAPAPGVRPVVGVWRPDANPKDPVNAGFAAMTDVVAMSIQQRLENFAPVDRVSPRVTQRVVEGVPNYLPRTTVSDPSTAKVRLEITIAQYGVQSSGDVAAFMVVNARMVHLSVGDKIWETTERVAIPMNRVPGLFNTPAGSLVELAAVSSFDDEQWRKVLDELTRAAGDAVLEQIRLDAVAS